MEFSEGGGREVDSMLKFQRAWKKKKRKGVEFLGKTTMEIPEFFFFIHYSILSWKRSFDIFSYGVGMKTIDVFDEFSKRFPGLLLKQFWQTSCIGCSKIF